MMLYAVYDFSCDTWYMLGAYATSTEVCAFYQTMLAAPFWKDRMSALYVVGSFDQDTGLVTPLEKARIMQGGSSVSQISSVSEDSDSSSKSEGFSVFRKIFGKKSDN